MMKQVLTSLLLIMVIAVTAVPVVVFAAELDPNTIDSTGGSQGLQNPLQFNSITEFFGAILNIVIIFAVPIIVFFIMYAGFLYVTAQGDPPQIQKATSALTWAVVGGLLILGAWVLIEVIKGTIDVIKS